MKCESRNLFDRQLARMLRGAANVEFISAPIDDVGFSFRH
jgi:hypothetical protein